jgi:TusE/DsrC/DsvC family sulfur relay protein
MISNQLDDEGFLVDSNLWSEKLSREMAEKQFNIELTEKQLTIIIYMREYYKKWETLPLLKTLRNEFNLDVEQIDELFKRGNSTARGVICKLAGLPKLLCIASGC